MRADASDAARGDWGVARALGAQLIELMPDEAARPRALSRDVLGHVLDGLRGDAPRRGRAPERSLLIRELRDFVLALARAQRLLIAVDDVDRIDEPSAALLAALAHKAERHPLMLALAIDSDDETRRSRRSLRCCARLSRADRARQLCRRADRGADALGVRRRAEPAAVRGPHPRACAGQPARDDGAGAAPGRSRARALREPARWSLPASSTTRDLPSDARGVARSAAGATLGADARELCEVLCARRRRRA